MSEKLTDNMIEDKLARAIDEATPDMLGDLMAELGIRDESPVMLRDALEERRWEPAQAITDTDSDAGKKPGRISLKTIAAACAALLIVIGGFSYFGGNGPAETFAVVGLDVNPSIEISIDNNEKVISADAINDDGRAVLDGMDLSGTGVDVACNAVLGSMLAKGYLTNTSNSVLVSVRAADAARGREIEETLSGNLNSFMENSEVTAAILGQYVEDDDALEDFAEAHGISSGKAWLIRSLLETGDPKLSEESLLMLSTQELVLLAQEKNVNTEVSYGAADTSKYIGHERATEIALKAAGVSKTDAAGIKSEFDADNGMIVYEVEFRAGGKEYEYDISAADGKIISKEIENSDETSGASGDDDDDRDDDRDDHDDDRNDDHDDDRDDDHDDDRDDDD